MTTTTFVNNVTPIQADWLNDVNASTYQGLFGPTISYVDTGTVGSFTSTTAGYNQLIVQNKSNATNASANFNVSNDVASATTNFVEMGINSSTFTGTGSFSQAGNAYVAAASTDLVLGTYGPKSVRFVVNSGATDAMVIDSSGAVGIGGTPTAPFSITRLSGAYAQLTSSFGSVYLNMSVTDYHAYTTTNVPHRLGVQGIQRILMDTLGNTLHTEAAGGLGYGTGAGGTVTQITSKSTAVTLNKPTGQITMNNAALAAATAIQFQLNNSLLAVADQLVVTFTENGVSYSPYLATAVVNAGSAQIILRNLSAGSLSDAVKINFAIIKGSIS